MYSTNSEGIPYLWWGRGSNF